MSHLTRAGLLLGLFIAAFLFMRSASAMVTLEWIGLTHGDNPREWAMLPVQNQDPAVCVECHEPTSASWEMSDHTTVTCENCHGATKEHVELAREDQVVPLRLSDARDLCLFCHAELSARPTDFPQVDVATHSMPAEGEGEMASCTSCHNPHQPGIPSAVPHEIDLPPNCLGCHGQDRWVPVSDAHVGNTNRDCLTCHRPGEEEK